jgi:hypothetical protein
LRKDQALALLELLADLYVIANAPDPEPAAEPIRNGREPATVKT